MSDERIPAGSPSTPSADGVTPTPEPSAGGGFLIDDQDMPPLDGEQLFRQAVAPLPPRPPQRVPITPLYPAAAEDDPAPTDATGLARYGGLIAIGIGILALISTRELPFPLFLIIGGAILAFYVASPARLKREQVVDRWDCLINAAQGRGNEVVAATTARIDTQRLPFVHYEQHDLAASRLRGGTRPFLVITHQGNGRLRPYRMHISVRDYGHNL